MRKESLAVGKLYRVVPTPGLNSHAVLLAAPSCLGKVSGSGRISGISVGPEDVILLVAIQVGCDYSAYELLALLGERLVFVRHEWIEEI